MLLSATKFWGDLLRRTSCGDHPHKIESSQRQESLVPGMRIVTVCCWSTGAYEGLALAVTCRVPGPQLFRSILQREKS